MKLNRKNKALLFIRMKNAILLNAHNIMDKEEMKLIKHAVTHQLLNPNKVDLF